MAGTGGVKNPPVAPFTHSAARRLTASCLIKVNKTALLAAARRVVEHESAAR